MSTTGWKCVSALAVIVGCSMPLEASTIYVAAGGNLQNAINAAQPGDTILLAEGAEFVGNFLLPAKVGDEWITIRTATPDTLLPPAGVRVQPAHAPLLARIRSSNSIAALRTAAGAHHWAVQYLEFAANPNGYGDIIRIGDGSSAQNTLDKVPHHFVLRHLYVHGDPRFGQKRGISLNAAHVTIADSHVSECKGVGQDTQAIGGWNGPGPYLIENNHLEGAGENVMFGGADPAIPGLVADGITFRRNYLTRPMAWRQPIIATTAGVAATPVEGGSLEAGQYAYRVVARGSVGQGGIGRSTASTEVSATLGAAGGAVHIRWQPVEGASEYRVYGRKPGAQVIYWRVTTTEFVDTGAAGTAEAVPTSTGTVWTVKNLFELKNARNVVVEGNILENHWKESQPGYSIVLTPRNSNGACTWCVVEHVRFENNIVRNVAAGINLTGYDIAARPTRQSNDIVFRNNLFTGLSTTLGGNGWFLLVGDGPRDLVIEHNTIDSNGNTVLNVYGGTSTDPREVYGFQMSANAARHGTYGINGAFFPFGHGILNGYFPDAVFVANYLAGGSAARYPAGTRVDGEFADQFVSLPVDYSVHDSSMLKGAAPDGSDIGVDHAVLVAAVAGVESGSSPLDIRPPTAAFTLACTYLDCTFVMTSESGSTAITGATWNFGDGVEADGLETVHSFAAAGTYTVTLSVLDTNGLTAAVAKEIRVEAPNVGPTATFVPDCTGLVCAFTETSTDPDGQVVSWAWTVGSATSSTQSFAYTFPAPGTYEVTLTVTDDDGATASVAKEITVEAPNVAPTAAFVPVCTDLGCTFTDASIDPDGHVASWAWTVGSATSSTQSFTYTFPAPGTHQVTLTVTDDDGATASMSMSVEVTALMHASLESGSTKRWGSSSKHYWSADVIVGIHGEDERPIVGATVTAAWSGAVTRTVTCVTTATGSCTFKSGTLSMLRSWVTLTITNVSAPRAVYDVRGNHGLADNANGTAVTYLKP